MGGIPLPYCDRLKKSIRWRSVSFFQDDTIWIISPLGAMKREFVFEDAFIDIKTEIFSLFSFKHIYLSLSNDREVFEDNDNLEFSGCEYSASGKLKQYVDKSKISVVKLKVLND